MIGASRVRAVGDPNLELFTTGKFVLDGKSNPPPLKPLVVVDEGRRTVELGRNVALRLGHQSDLLEGLLDARIVPSLGFTGLGDVEGGCVVICASNSCSQWALRARRPRIVAKVIGVMADQPRFVLLAQPKLKSAPRARRESIANRREGGLVPFVLVEPGRVECAICPGPNVGEVYLRARH
jgi:hypothetical protein